MAIGDYLFPDQPSYMTGLLGEDEALKAKQQAQTSGLLATGLGIIMGSAPSSQRQGILQTVAPGIMAGQQAYQGAYDRQIQDQMTAAKFADMKRQMAIKDLLPSLYQETTDDKGNKTQSINKDVFQKIAFVNPELAKQISEGQISARKAGLLPGMDMTGVSPIAPYLSSQSPQVRQLAAQLEQGYKKGIIDEDTALKRIESLAKMEDQFIGRSESAADRALTRDMARQERELKKGDLSSEQQKQVTGAQNTVNAISEFKTELENFDPRSFANLSPADRSKIQTKYRNMQLQAKEAYNLGVLNGPDLTIIEQLVADPTSYKGAMIGREGINAQASELSRIIKDMGTVASGKPKTVTEAPTQPGMPSMSAIDAEIARRKKGQK
jgi:hypothetical protein